MAQFTPGSGDLSGKIFSGWKRKVETISNVGSYATPSKILSAIDSGLVMFVDIGTVSVVIQLPSPTTAGLWFKIILATASDNEATKDLVITTGDNDIDIVGVLNPGSAIFEMDTGSGQNASQGTSAIALDTSDGAATIGDWFDFASDGSYWIVNGRLVTTAAIDIAHTYNGHTVP
jgi:hypothetical protein